MRKASADHDLMCSYVYQGGAIQAKGGLKQVNLVKADGTFGASVKFPQAISSEVRLSRTNFFGHAKSTEEEMKLEFSRSFVVVRKVNGAVVSAKRATITLGAGKMVSDTCSGEGITGGIFLNGKLTEDKSQSVLEYLLPVKVAPEVLAMNTNFDEGDVDGKTHYAKPDCENDTPKAASDHLDGNWKEGDIVTDDLHKGFFGLRPGTLPYTETAGAVVKTKKLDKNDPETNHKQSGHVRLYAVCGTQGSESEMKIELFDKDSLVANDIGPQLYHQDPNTPMKFYLEGVEPGKITLEFSCRKGSTNFKHEQEFLVATHQTKDKWLKEIRYQLLLRTNGVVDLDHYLPNNGGWRPRPAPASGASSFVWHKDRVRAIYDYYGQLFEQEPDKLDWMGAARMVGGAVYGGWLCDLQASTPSFSVMDELIGGQILIYRDLAWQHRSYVASGTWALEWVDEHDSGSVNGTGGQDALKTEIWREFDGSIQHNIWGGVKDA